MYNWASVYATISLAPPKIENAFDEHLNPSESFNNMCKHYAFIKLVKRSLNRRNPMFDYYANKINQYGGEV